METGDQGYQSRHGGEEELAALYGPIVPSTDTYKRLAFLATLGSNRTFALVTLIRKRCFAPTTFAVPDSPQLTPQLAACLAFR